jgi:ABC-2 type transport system permease protein
MKRALGLVERDMRKFRRSPALLFASLVLPLVQLVILGNAFGGNIKNVNLGVVNLDRGPESVDVLERVRAVGANARTFLPSDYDDQGAALSDLRKGVLGGVLIIPQHYSRDLLEQHQPHLALITDNTDRSVAGANRLYARALPRAQAAESKQLAPLSAADQRQLVAAMQKLIEHSK